MSGKANIVTQLDEAVRVCAGLNRTVTELHERIAALTERAERAEASNVTLLDRVTHLSHNARGHFKTIEELQRELAYWKDVAETLLTDSQLDAKIGHHNGNAGRVHDGRTPREHCAKFEKLLGRGPLARKVHA